MDRRLQESYIMAIGTLDMFMRTGEPIPGGAIEELVGEVVDTIEQKAEPHGLKPETNDMELLIGMVGRLLLGRFRSQFSGDGQ